MNDPTMTRAPQHALDAAASDVSQSVVSSRQAKEPIAGVPMPPMPSRYRTIQIAYARMISEVQDVIRGTRLTPQMALLVAFIGDQTVSLADIRRYGYFIGTSASYSVAQLVKEYLVEHVNERGGADRRRRPIKLTRPGLRIAALLRQKLANTPRAGEIQWPN